MLRVIVSNGRLVQPRSGRRWRLLRADGEARLIQRGVPIARANARREVSHAVSDRGSNAVYEDALARVCTMAQIGLKSRPARSSPSWEPRPLSIVVVGEPRATVVSGDPGSFLKQTRDCTLIQITFGCTSTDAARRWLTPMPGSIMSQSVKNQFGMQ
jgi:hypothetical protein